MYPAYRVSNFKILYIMKSASTRNVWLNGLVDGSLTTYATLQLTELAVLAENDHDVVTHLGWSPCSGDIGELVTLGNGKLVLGVTLTNLNAVSHASLRLLDVIDGCLCNFSHYR